MPRINANTLEQHQTTVGGYAYSAATIDHTIAPEQTLFTLSVDASGSVAGFLSELEMCVQAIVEGCKNDPRADYMMLRLLAFSDTVREVHGFKPLAACEPKDYVNIIRPGGQTSLYEAIDNAGNATDSYAAKLKERDRDSNSLIVCITDGCDNVGSSRGLTVASVKETFERLLQQENTESLLSVLIGVNMKDQGVKSVLATLEAQGGFSQFVAIEDCDANTFAQIAGFVIQSASAQSSHINTGGPSKPINPQGFTF